MGNENQTAYTCPSCKSPIKQIRDEASNESWKPGLACENGHSFVSLDGIPVLLREEDAPQAHKVEAFSGLSSEYEAKVDLELVKYWGIRYEDLVKRMCTIALSSKPARLLDVSTGIALLPLAILSASGGEISVTGIDITLPMLKKAASRIAASGNEFRIGLVCASGLNIPFPDESFDVVTCVLGSHHMDAMRFILEAKRVLRRSGALVISDAVSSSFFRSFMGKFVLSLLLREYESFQSASMAKMEKEALGRLLTVKEWKILLKESDFKVQSVYSLKPKNPFYPGGMVIKATRASGI